LLLMNIYIYIHQQQQTRGVPGIRGVCALHVAGEYAIII